MVGSSNRIRSCSSSSIFASESRIRCPAESSDTSRAQKASGNPNPVKLASVLVLNA